MQIVLPSSESFRSTYIISDAHSSAWIKVCLYVWADLDNRREEPGYMVAISRNICKDTFTRRMEHMDTFYYR